MEGVLKAVFVWLASAAGGIIRSLYLFQIKVARAVAPPVLSMPLLPGKKAPMSPPNSPGPRRSANPPPDGEAADRLVGVWLKTEPSVECRLSKTPIRAPFLLKWSELEYTCILDETCFCCKFTGIGITVIPECKEGFYMTYIHENQFFTNSHSGL
jgi:hypothetical protein